MIYQNEEYVLEITENMFIYAWYNCRFQYRKKYINWSFKEQYFPICIFNDLNQVTNNSIKMLYRCPLLTVATKTRNRNYE